MEELISVVVPIYNVEEYLRKCLSSIRGQTYKNLEVILVDDGSQDESGRICDEYAEIGCGWTSNMRDYEKRGWL